MSAQDYTSEVLRKFYGPIAEQENAGLPQPLIPEAIEVDDVFILSRRDNFREWLCVWKMVVSEENPYNNDLLAFARVNKEKFTTVVKNEIEALRGVKVSFGLKAKFSIERNGEIQTMEHYFYEKNPHVFVRPDKGIIKSEFQDYIQNVKGEIEYWSTHGSGWVLERIMLAYVNIARYQALRGGTFLELPTKLKNKKVVINVKNRDNECLKWSLRAALFPPKDGKDAQRPSKYPVVDGINYRGIDFPTPVKQHDKLEAQKQKPCYKCLWMGKRYSYCAQSQQERNKRGKNKHYVD